MPYRTEVPAPEDATDLERIIALSGRNPAWQSWSMEITGTDPDQYLQSVEAADIRDTMIELDKLN